MNMSMEGAPRSEDIDAAMELIEGDPFLKGDRYVQQVIENEGKTDSGSVVDIGDFIAARRAFLVSEAARVRLAALEGTNPDTYHAAVAVVPSVRPDLEQALGL